MFWYFDEGGGFGIYAGLISRKIGFVCKSSSCQAISNAPVIKFNLEIF